MQLSSIAYRSGRIRLADLNYEQGYKPFPVYSQSKLAMLMFALELDRRSRAHGWGITSIAAHPGISRTELVANGPTLGGSGLMTSAMNLMVRLMGQSAAAGALPTLMAASMPGIVRGQYFGPQGLGEFRGPPGQGRIEPYALDGDVAAKLWAVSEQLTGVTFKLPHDCRQTVWSRNAGGGLDSADLCVERRPMKAINPIMGHS